MKVGFSFSPGGLLLPYHLGVMDSLQDAGHLQPHTPIAGASAGAIAVACHGAGLKSTRVLDATAALAAEVQQAGGAQRRLIPVLRRKMQEMIGPEQLEELTARPGTVGIAYQQLFPTNVPILQTSFTSIDDLIDAVSFSSTFPFFSDQWPVALDTRQRQRPASSQQSRFASLTLPRIVVDGFFTVPRDRLGCPDLKSLHADLEHEILVACFPQDKVRLTAVSSDYCISPPENAFDGIILTDNENDNDGANSIMRINEADFDGKVPAERIKQQQEQQQPQTGMANFMQLAMESASASAYFKVYEQGLADGEAWSFKFSQQQQQHQQQQERDLARLFENEDKALN